MGRLSILISIVISLIASSSFATTEKEREELRLETLQKELKKEETSLHNLQEELTFYFASGEGTPEQISELKQNILASEENIKFLTAEIQNAKGEKPQTAKGRKPSEDTPQKKNRMWWDVYSREKTIQ